MKETVSIYDQYQPNIWFTSDTHFSHGNIIKYALRPWLDDVGKEILIRLDQCDPEAEEQWKKHRLPKENIAEHDEALMINWNSVVDVDDDVYHLGDFAFGKPERMKEILDCLNGNIHLIKGNHDRNINKVKDCFVWIRDYSVVKIKNDDAEWGIQDIVMSHYAFRVWDKAHYGSFACAGHSHNSLLKTRFNEVGGGLILDVGVDSAAYYFGGDKPEDINYRPFSYEDIKSIMLWKKSVIGNV